MNRRRILSIALLTLPALAACGRADTPTLAPVGSDPTQSAQAPAATATLTPSSTPLPTPSPLPDYTPTPTSTPLPTLAPLPTETPMPDATKPNPPRQPDLMPVSPAQPAPAGSVSLPAPYGPLIDQQIADAKKDLSQRLGIGIDAIEVAQVLAVTWPDGSLGCPRPDMAYPQVLVDGLLVELRANNTIYSYHGDGKRPLFLCQ